MIPRKRLDAEHRKVGYHFKPEHIYVGMHCIPYEPKGTQCVPYCNVPPYVYSRKINSHAEHGNEESIVLWEGLLAATCIKSRLKAPPTDIFVFFKLCVI